MRRASAAVLALVVVLASLVSAWLWWSAPPTVEAAQLLAAIQIVPPDADGAAAAVASRRWVLRQRRLGVLAAAALGGTWSRIRGMAPIYGALLDAGEAPLVVWWHDDETAAATLVRADFLPGLRQVASLRGLSWSEATRGDLVTVQIGTCAQILSTEQWPEAAADGERLTAVVRTGEGLWSIRARRSSVRGWRGSPPPLPEVGTTSSIVLSDLGRLASAAGFSLPGSPRGAALLFSSSGAWGVKLRSSALRDLWSRLGGTTGDGAASRWQSPLGAVWVGGSEAQALASDRATLEEVLRLVLDRGHGSVRGADAVWLLERAARVLDDVPGLGVDEADLRPAVAAFESLGTVRWFSAHEGGAFAVEW